MLGTFSLVEEGNCTVRATIVILTVSWELGQSSEFFPGGSPGMEGLTLKVYDFLCVFIVFVGSI